MAIKTHSVKDEGAPFVVDPFARKVTVPPQDRVIGVVGDHLSEQVTFQVPKVIDGHNMPNCTRKYIAWRNVDGEPGTDELKISEETEDYALYTWTVRDLTAAAKGVVSFSLHFEDDDPDTGRQIYSWGTHTCTACEILDSVNARLGVYASIYVAGEALVFADYTPVVDEKLTLDTPGVVPEGTIKITTNGVHDVAAYAAAEVEVPTDRPPVITVEDGGLVVATTGTQQGTTTQQLNAPTISVNQYGVVRASTHGMETVHKLSSSDDADLIPDNIVEGVEIFGTKGTRRIKPDKATLRIQVTKPSAALPPYFVMQASVTSDGSSLTGLNALETNTAREVSIGSLVFVTITEGLKFSAWSNTGVERVPVTPVAADNVAIFKVTEAQATINMTLVLG